MLWKVLLAAGLGAILGLIVNGWMPHAARPTPSPNVYPLPHLVPKYPGGVALRLAMVQDVLHERFPKHSQAYYTQRNREVRDELAKLEKTPWDARPAERYFALFDDLGSGLDHLGDDDEAVRVLREKLRQQQERGWKGRDLYTTYANLGTFLIHGNFKQAMQDDAEAKARLREGLQFIHCSIEVNPEAHFGREIWQAVAVEYLLGTLPNPELLLQYDMVGDRLGADIDPQPRRCYQENWTRLGDGRQAKILLSETEPINPGFRPYLRQNITTVGAEEGWCEAVCTSHFEPVPFDEPVLGIIGMWRLGGGANPHFALALGEIMLRVGQRYLAWCAYERAAGMEERFWPDPNIRRKFVAHCRARQELIEKQLPEHERAELRPRFQAELAFGQRYQQAYQDYEARRIADGVALEDPHFYDTFHAEHEPIASPVGQSDKFFAVSSHFELPRVPFGSMLFFAGLCAFLTACFVRPRKRP
ncbi:MAG TPA: hypothetical protein VH575_36225 [Gemmataceae bacterium]|jgi:tetratricopeptide (TPR) repeat protein